MSHSAASTEQIQPSLWDKNKKKSRIGCSGQKVEIRKISGNCFLFLAEEERGNFQLNMFWVFSESTRLTAFSISGKTHLNVKALWAPVVQRAQFFKNIIISLIITRSALVSGQVREVLLCVCFIIFRKCHNTGTCLSPVWEKALKHRWDFNHQALQLQQLVNKINHNNHCAKYDLRFKKSWNSKYNYNSNYFSVWLLNEFWAIKWKHTKKVKWGEMLYLACSLTWRCIGFLP